MFTTPRFSTIKMLRLSLTASLIVISMPSDLRASEPTAPPSMSASGPISVLYGEYCSPWLQNKDGQQSDLVSNPTQTVEDAAGNSGTITFDNATTTFTFKNSCSSKGELKVDIMGKPFTAAPCAEKEIHFVLVGPENHDLTGIGGRGQDPVASGTLAQDIMSGPDRIKALGEAAAHGASAPEKGQVVLSGDEKGLLASFLVNSPSGQTVGGSVLKNGPNILDLGDGNKLEVTYDEATFFLTVKNACESSSPVVFKVLDFSFTINPCTEKYVYLAAYPCSYIPTAEAGDEIPGNGLDKNDGLENPEELREPTSQV